jgi:type II secretory pathway component GspD/PulD (secretin)
VRSPILLRWFVPLSLLLCACVALAQQSVLEVITLKYRNVDQVLPILRPLVAPGGTLTGMNNRLIVRTTPANLAELKQVLEAIDARPRQLVIQVRQDADIERSRRGGQISGTADLGDAGQVTVPGRPRPGGATVSGDGGEVQVYSSEAQRTDRVSQSVRVSEGNAAFIRIGQSIPVQSRQVIVGPGGAVSQQSTQYRDVDSGFYVTPRVNGDRVTLEIAAANDRVIDPATGASSIQRVQTVVAGRLGEWIEIGGTAEQRTRDESVILGRSSDAGRDYRRVLLKVEEAR